MLNNIRRLLSTLLQGAAASSRSEAILHALRREYLLSGLAQTKRFQEPKRLLCHGYKVYSEGHEDGYIQEIFRRVGTKHLNFVEIASANGLECNTTYLLLQGWRGAWFECDARQVEQASQLFASYPVHIQCITATPANVDGLIAAHSVSGELDLLSIDIDSYDYWLWDAIKSVKPRVVVIEYNASLPPECCKTLPSSALPLQGTNYFGASLGALASLATRKGYALVGCTTTGVNAFFVRSDLVEDKFCAPYTAVNHYEPPRYGLVGPNGHRPGFGPWIDG
jgi:hypothetical protein